MALGDARDGRARCTMQRIPPLAGGLVMAATILAGCSVEAQPGPPVIVESLAHQASVIRLRDEFDCRPGDTVRIDWGRRLTSAEDNAAGRGGVMVQEIDWSGRTPTAAELADINSAVSPYITPRSANVSCRGSGHVLTLEFWEVREGATRIAVEMDSNGFRVIPAATPR